MEFSTQFICTITSEATFKQCYGNHKKSFNRKKHRTDTELSKEYWKLKESKAQPQVQFYILRRCWRTKRAGIFYLCLNGKLFFIECQGNTLPNQRNELISKCRDKNKFEFMKLKTWPLCGMCPCLKLSSGVTFFPHLDWIWRLAE